MDVTEVSAGTTSKGATVKPDQAVNSFIAVPTAANAVLFAGVAEGAIASGAYDRHVVCGHKKVRVRNTSGAGITFPVGAPLQLVPGQAYFETLFTNISAGHASTKVVSNGGSVPHAIVTVATAIAADTTGLVDAYVFMSAGPVPFVFSFPFFSAIAADTCIPPECCFLHPAGPGRITRAGIGCTDSQDAGTLTLDVKIATTSIFTTLPVCGLDDSNPGLIHTLIDSEALASTFGTGTVFGLINQSANEFLKGNALTFEVANGSSHVGLGVHVQIEGYLY
jgi:hypothetical protein